MIVLHSSWRVLTRVSDPVQQAPAVHIRQPRVQKGGQHGESSLMYHLQHQLSNTSVKCTAINFCGMIT